MTETRTFDPELVRDFLYWASGIPGRDEWDELPMVFMCEPATSMPSRPSVHTAMTLAPDERHDAFEMFHTSATMFLRERGGDIPISGVALCLETWEVRDGDAVSDRLRAEGRLKEHPRATEARWMWFVEESGQVYRIVRRRGREYDDPFFEALPPDRKGSIEEELRFLAKLMRVQAHMRARRTT